MTWWMFELNLYGIEISISLGYLIIKIVWIEPLWNWNTLPIALPIEEKKFELNLYGIEIWTNCALVHDGRSLNWTFMELKLVTLVSIPCLLNVWIEPLWNWNACHEYRFVGIGEFELNLYGIEIYVI